jgi:hypothetical protein
MRRRCLTLVVLIACRDPSPPPPPPPAPPHDGVTLVQPGTAPRQTLRYHLTKGIRVTSQLECDADIKSSELGGPMPTQIVALETVVDDVLPDGAAKLRITVIDAGIRERPGAEAVGDVMRAQTVAMRGVVISETLAPDGNISEARVEAGATSDKLHRELDGLLRNLEHVATRLPAEPVGVGAMWRERRTLPEGGVRAVSEITYTLASLDRTEVGYHSIGESIGEPQTIEQDGTKLEVTDTHGRTSASGTVDLARYAPDLAASSTFATTMKVIAPSPGSGDGRSTIEIAMTIRMTSEHPITAAAPASTDPSATTSPPAETGGSHSALPAATAPPPAGSRNPPSTATNTAGSGGAPSTATPPAAAPSEHAPSTATAPPARGSDDHAAAGSPHETAGSR